MVSYNRVPNDEEIVLCDSPNHSIPQHSSSDDLRDSNNAQDPLLSSFHEEEVSVMEGGKSSDDRLRTHELDEISRNIQEATFNATSDPQPSSSSGTAPHSSSPSSALTMNAISSNFNFLDRVFKRQDKRGPMGSNNDGVFSNMSAKPEAHTQVESDKPPTYAEAAADATPPYWENSILAPGFNDEVFVDGLPVGSLVNFIWNLLVSSSFQFVGFLLTYILHTSHAAKQGSRAGLGMTFLSYGYYLLPSKHSFSSDDSKLASTKLEPTNANDYDVGSSNTLEGDVDDFQSSLSSGLDLSATRQTDTKAIIVAIAISAFGGFIFIRAFIDYHRARKMEEVILAPPSNLPPRPEEV